MQQRVRCPNCGAMNLSGVKFCSICGTPMGNICSSCGAPLNPTDRFCSNCGAQVFSQSTAPPQSGWQAQSAPRQTYTPPQQSYTAPQQTWEQPAYAPAWAEAPRRQSSMPLVILLIVLIIALGAFAWWAFFSNGISGGGGKLEITSGPFISVTGNTSGSTRDVNVLWETNIKAVAQVEYGTDESYGSMTNWSTNYVTSHNIAVTNLTPDTRYHYRVIVKDEKGNVFTSGDYTFKTPQ